MKNKNIKYIGALTIVALLSLPLSALGAATTFAQDTTVTLTLSGTDTNFTITAGTAVDSVVTTINQITVTISGGQSFSLSSANGYHLTNDGGFSYSCPTGGSSLLSVSLPVGSGSRTFNITPTRTACSSSSSGSGGGGGGGGGGSSSSTPTPTPAATVTPAASPVVSAGVSLLKQFNLREGDIVSASGSDDPDVYIVNEHGYKRLFLNPVIFGFYGHLGGFSKVKNVSGQARSAFVTSGLFRNCEAGDQKVYGVETSGEDTGILHWVNTTGAQAVADDPNFFKKVFCINNKEFNWYPKGAAYTSVNQVPAYTRITSSASTSTPTSGGQVKVVATVDYLNVRDMASTQGKIVGQANPGDVLSYSSMSNGWYQVKKDGKSWGWVSGQYVTVVK